MFNALKDRMLFRFPLKTFLLCLVAYYFLSQLPNTVSVPLNNSNECFAHDPCDNANAQKSFGYWQPYVQSNRIYLPNGAILRVQTKYRLFMSAEEERARDYWVQLNKTQRQHMIKQFENELHSQTLHSNKIHHITPNFKSNNIMRKYGPIKTFKEGMRRKTVNLKQYMMNETIKNIKFSSVEEEGPEKSYLRHSHIFINKIQKASSSSANARPRHLIKKMMNDFEIGSANSNITNENQSSEIVSSKLSPTNDNIDEELFTAINAIENKAESNANYSLDLDIASFLSQEIASGAVAVDFDFDNKLSEISTVQDPYFVREQDDRKKEENHVARSSSSEHHVDSNKETITKISKDNVIPINGASTMASKPQCSTKRSEIAQEEETMDAAQPLIPCKIL